MLITINNFVLNNGLTSQTCGHTEILFQAVDPTNQLRALPNGEHKGGLAS